VSSIGYQREAVCVETGSQFNNKPGRSRTQRKRKASPASGSHVCV
jgi:hypothetical protein